uniref:MYND-type domain-containing protein n=1 Tax=Picocystis salinarum TaxID=88271 RepID=A0A7S3UGN9_9CHLO
MELDMPRVEEEEEEEETDDVSEAFQRQQKRTGKKRVATPGASLYIARRGTPLHVCAAASRAGIAKHLVCDAGADVRSQEGPQKSTALHIASRCGNLKICKLLLDNGADVNARDKNSETPLMRAVEGGHLDIACILIERGSNVCAENEAGLTALHIAAALARKNFFPLLVEQGANPNCPCSKQYKDWDGGRTPVHYAAHNGELDAFLSLVKLGGNPRALSKVGWPPLFYAVEAKNLSLSESIMDEDLKLELHCTVSGNRTPLMVAAMQDWKEGATAILKRYPFTLNWQDEIGRTALHWASLRTSTGVMEVLYDAGANKDILDKDGKTAGELYTGVVRPPPKRQWEEERKGAMGESQWDYTQVMENTAFRYVRKAMAAKRTREIAREKQCAWCKRYTFEAKRCGACKNAFYCGNACQKKDWNEGGHRLHCFTKFVDPSLVSQHLENKTRM